MNKMPVPSQMIIAKTIQGRNLRSICNKILNQMIGKVGGIPWIIDNLPFSNTPTMIIGIDTYKKVGTKNNVLGVLATTDHNFSKFWSKSVLIEPTDKLEDIIQSHVKTAITEFFNINKCPPKNIFTFRDGLGPTKKKNTD